jgi:hypothetical protein
MFQGTPDTRDHGRSIRSVSVADPDGPRRVEQTIRLLLDLSAARSDAEDTPVTGGDHESGLFGITEAEASGRINQGWEHFGEFHSIAYHKPAEYWAHHMYFGHDSYWWIRDEATRERLGLGPVGPLPYP